MQNKQTSLIQKDFTLVVVGQIISLFGNAILRFALPLYLLRETGSSTLFGAVGACSFLPMIVLSLAGGVVADKVNKRNIMVVLDFSTAVLIGAFYLALGKLPVVPLIIVFLMSLYGISGAYQPAVQASIPVLVKPAALMRGNAVINMVNTLSGLLGPVIGGILFEAWGILPILAVSSLCFLCSAIMEIFIHIPHQKQSAAAGVLATVKSDLRESWHFVKEERPALLAVVWTLVLFNLALSASMIVGIPVIVVNILGMTDTSLGFTQGALGLGGLAGGLLAGIVAPKFKLRQSYLLLLVCAAGALCMGAALLPGVSPSLSYGVITAVSFAAMAASTLFTVQMCTVVQQQTPPHLVGKIMAAILAVTNCAQPVGQALYGFLFDLCAGFPWAVLLGASIASFFISLYSKGAFLRLEHESTRPVAAAS